MVRQIKKILGGSAVGLFAALIVTACGIFITAEAFAQTGSGAEKVAPSVVQSLTAGQPQDVIVLLDDSAIRSEAETMRGNLGVTHDTPGILEVKKTGYQALKQWIMGFLSVGGQEILQDYSHLPMVFMRINSLSGMQQLLGRPEVVGVYENKRYSPVLSTSLPFINQPQVAALGIVGTGTTVAVLDERVDYTNPAFGTCTGVGHTPGLCSDTNPPSAPPGCKVACTRDFDTGILFDHATNVAGIVLGVAPDTRVAALNVFRSDGFAYSDRIINAINWCIANQSAYNIVAMNLSLGDASSNSSPCSGDTFANPISNARSAGILAAIASGNSGFTNGLSSPACVPSAVSVGAVYDANYGPVSYSICTDATTSPDKVTCFSNSANYLTILAPGSFITAAGIQMSGTSQATPHIAGSIAVLRGQSAFPSETLDQTVTRMTSTGHPDLDTRNGITKPRIDLLAAVNGGGGQVTYSISGTITISGTTTPISGVTVNLGGGATASTTTNSSGTYQFAGLSNGSYTVTPGSSAYTFSPVNRSLTINGSSITGQNFSGKLVYSISGKAVNNANSPLAGVAMTLSGAATGSTTTDGSGNYTFTGLSKGSYTVKPGMTGYVFVPASRTVTIGTTNVSGINFTGAYSGGATTYSISGTITISGTTTPISGVTVNLGGGATASTTTNSSGTYQFAGLSNGSYTVTPGSSAYTFSPVNRSLTINGSSITGQNFSGKLVSGTTYSISGKAVNNANSPLAGVVMTLSGAATGSTTTDGSGNYTFTGLSKGSYTVKPGMTGYVFVPASRTVTIGTTNVSGINFIGITH